MKLSHVALITHLFSLRIHYIFSRMSRSALWRQEGARKMREKEAEELFAFALNEGRVSSGRFFFSLFFFVHWT